MLAQETGPPPPANERRPPQAPIDEGIFILIIIGLLYGVFVAYKKYQTKNTPA